MTEIASEPRRRFLRFSLRNLLISVSFVAVVLAWSMHKAREQGIAVAALNKLGCDIGYDDPNDSGREWTSLERLRQLFGDERPWNVVCVFTDRASLPITDADCLHLHALTGLGELHLEHSIMTDAGLASLQGLSLLGYLDLADASITDTGMVHLRGLTQLRTLSLNATDIGDAGSVYFRGLTNLERLYLWDTRLTDDGVVHLQGLIRLQELDLDGTQVSDAGLAHLRGLAQLQLLELRGTRVTEAGVSKLQEALPNCVIHRPVGKNARPYRRIKTQSRE